MALLMMFQSCKVYYKDYTTLEEAAHQGKETKIITTKNKTLKFKSVILEDGNYYGIKKMKGESIKVPIDLHNVKSVNILNENVSTIVSIVLPLAIIIGGLVIISNLDFAPDFGGSGYW